MLFIDLIGGGHGDGFEMFSESVFWSLQKFCTIANDGCCARLVSRNCKFVLFNFVGRLLNIIFSALFA